MLSNGVTVTATRATKCSPWFPPLGPPVGSTLPSTGSSEASSPVSTVLWRCATSCASLARLGCLRRAIPCVAPVVSLPAVQDAQPRAWGAAFRSPPPDHSAGRQAGPPTFLENPDCFYARFFDSGRTARPHYHDGAAARPPLREPRGLLRPESFEAQSPGLKAGCLRFAGWVAPPPRKTRFQVLVKLSWAGLLTRRVSSKGFRVISSSSPKLSWRNPLYSSSQPPAHLPMK